MAVTFTRRRLAAFGAGLAAAGGFGKSAFADPLPDALDRLREIFPVDPPPFSFTDASGKKLTLADYRGSGLVVNFWATWCFPCKQEMPTLAALNKVLTPEGILVLPISVNSTGAAAVKPYFTTHHIEGLPVLLDPSSSALGAFKAEGIPLTVIIDRKGQMVARTLGGANWNTPAVASRIRSLVGAKPASATPA